MAVIDPVAGGIPMDGIRVTPRVIIERTKKGGTQLQIALRNHAKNRAKEPVRISTLEKQIMRRSAFLGVTFVTLGILASCAPPVVKHYRPLLQDLQKQSALEETVKRSIGLPSVAVEKAKVPEVRKQFGFSNDPKLPTEILSEISLALFYGLDENNTLMVYFDNGHRMIGYEWGSQ